MQLLDKDLATAKTVLKYRINSLGDKIVKAWLSRKQAITSK